MPSPDSAVRELPEELRPHAAKINFDSTISRRLVHRNFIDHVLVTDILRLEGQRFLCGGRMPQSHCFFNEGGSPAVCSSILLCVEMARQAGIAISHQFLEVSPSLSYILRHLSCSLEQPGLGRVLSPEQASIVMEIRLRDCSYRRTGELTGLVMECVSYRAGERLLSAVGEWIFVPQKVYQKLRGNAPAPSKAGSAPCPQRIDSGAVGRSRPENVVISSPAEVSADLLEADLVVDPDHPYFFEHKLDHVSGMLLLEGCNQFGTAVAGKRCGWAPRDIVFKEFGARFHQFAELLAPVKLEARLEPSCRSSPDLCSLALGVEAKQGGLLLAQFSIAMATAAAFVPAQIGAADARAAAGGGS